MIQGDLHLCLDVLHDRLIQQAGAPVVGLRQCVDALPEGGSTGDRSLVSSESGRDER